jgi:superfamily I DNA/RNA helicase
MTVAFPLLPPEAWLFHCSLITSHSALLPNILSVQSSKGLEFRSVILVGLGHLDASDTKTADQMKLLYVGMTRANERLMITATGRNDFTERLESMAGKICAVA